MIMGISQSIPPVSLAFWRWVVAVMVFLPFAIKPLLSEWIYLKQHLSYLSMTALSGITLFNTLIYIAGHTTRAINLALISISFPIFILIFSRIIFNEILSWKKITGLVLVISGIIFLMTKGSPSQLLNINFAIGDLWMLIAAIIFAIYSILLKHKPETISIGSLQFSTFVLGLLFLLPFYFWEITTVDKIDYSINSIGAILYIGIFASLVAFLLWNKAISHIGPSKAAMIYYTLPLFSGLLAVFFLHEKLGYLHLFSALLIFSGILLATMKKSAQDQFIPADPSGLDK